MSRFISENYSRAVCADCKEVTTITPGFVFSKLNCKCDNKEVVKNLDTEISKPVQEEKEYSHKITVIGTFKNGDYEVCANNDLDNTYRVPKATFESDFEEVTTPELTTLNSDDIEIYKVIVVGILVNGDYEVYAEKDADKVKYIIDKETFERDYKENFADFEPGVLVNGDKGLEGTFSISLEDLKGKTEEEIKAKFTVDELRVLAKAVKIKGYTNMKEDNLVGKLLAKVK